MPDVTKLPMTAQEARNAIQMHNGLERLQKRAVNELGILSEQAGAKGNLTLYTISNHVAVGKSNTVIPRWRGRNVLTAILGRAILEIETL
jgi:hypothetical protein